MPDVRLIDANALIKQIEEIHCKDCDNYNGAMCRACEWMDAMDYIEDAPTIDAQPVKHGHWIIEEEEPMYGGHRKIWSLRCSECRKDPIKHIGGGLSNWWFQTPEFCPVCGSDNRGDSDADS